MKFRIENIPCLPHGVCDVVAPHASCGIPKASSVVKGCKKFHVIVLTYCLGNFSIDVTAGPHSSRIPPVYFTVPEEEGVMMDQAYASKLCTSVVHDMNPIICIKLWCRKKWDKVLVSKFFEWPVFFGVIGVNAFCISPRPFVQVAHVIGTTVSRYRVNAPMRVHTELCVLDPFRKWVLGKRLPSRFKVLLCVAFRCCENNEQKRASE